MEPARLDAPRRPPEGILAGMRAVFAQAAFLSAFVLPSAAFLWWGTLPPRLRRLVALAASAAGVVFLTIALGTAGQRETATMGSFVLGPGYVSGHAAASASLPYYVITAVCLLAGT